MKLVDAAGAAYELGSGHVPQDMAERRCHEAQSLCSDRECSQLALNLAHTETKQRLAALEDELTGAYVGGVKKAAREHVSRLEAPLCSIGRRVMLV